jgi:Cdc6-like AAA superfamily ATPase
LYRPARVEDFRCRSGPLPGTAAAQRLAVPQVHRLQLERICTHTHTIHTKKKTQTFKKCGRLPASFFFQVAAWLRDWKAAHGHAQAAALASASKSSQRGKHAFWLGGHGGSDDDDDDDGGPANACLLHGPPGVGKTAAVYAVAELLGTK